MDSVGGNYHTSHHLLSLGLYSVLLFFLLGIFFVQSILNKYQCREDNGNAATFPFLTGRSDSSVGNNLEDGGSEEMVVATMTYSV